MPKTPAASTTTRTTRRSSRLSKINDPHPQPVHLGAPSRTRKRNIPARQTQLCTNDDPASVTKPHLLDLRRSQRITPAELLRRETTLLKDELECKRRADDLDKRALLLYKKEVEASLVLSQIAEREAAASLAQLEEHFTCALCCEILAHPYTLNPGQCGHTFCAICILKWFFSRLHDHCGSWHESVDCPMCRSLLVITPERVPRPEATFPFVPNRAIAAVCESLIEKLRCTPSSALVVKREDSEGACVSGWSNCSRKEASKEADEKEENIDIAGWREGGFTRAEWLKKDREGKQEMNRISRSWTTLNSHDFREMKQKLGV